MVDDASAAPALSMVVVAFDMPRALPRTLFSLSRRYQSGVHDLSYEVIVVDNGSAEPVTADEVATFGEEFRLIRVECPLPSPAAAANVGIAAARGSFVGVLIDGARLLSPGALAQLSRQARAGSFAMLLAFHLGPDHQSRSIATGYDEAAEDGLLASIDWAHDGYGLFEISSVESSNPAGWFGPVAEATCFVVGRGTLARLGGFDERFQSPGGGLVNHDLLQRVARLDEVEITVVLGEGTFHQIHGGVTTNSGVDRWDDYADEFERITEHSYQTLRLDPIYVGRIPERALRWVGSATDVHRLLTGNESLQVQVGAIRAALDAERAAVTTWPPLVAATVVGRTDGYHADRWVSSRAILDVQLMRSASRVRIEGWIPPRTEANGVPLLITVSVFGSIETFLVPDGQFCVGVDFSAGIGATGTLTIDCSSNLVEPPLSNESTPDNVFQTDPRALAWRVFGITFEPSADSGWMATDLLPVRIAGAEPSPLRDRAAPERAAPERASPGSASAGPSAHGPWLEAWGTFNVDNLGDLLFPVVFGDVFRSAYPGGTMSLASPLGGPVAGWSDPSPGPFGPDGRTTRCISELDDEQFTTVAPDAIVVAGGDVIHDYEHRFMLPDGTSVTYPYSGLAASLLSLDERTTVGWHCVGIPADPGSSLERRLSDGLGRLSAISVRDAASLRRLERLKQPARIVPDAVWAIESVWPREQVLARHTSMVDSGRLPKGAYVAIHLSAWDGDDLAPLVAAVRSLGQVGVERLLVSIGPCMGDDETACAIASRTDSWVCAASDIADRVAAIAGASGYVGMALHGGVVAAAYGVPTVWLRDSPKTRQAADDLGGDRIASIGDLSMIVRTMMDGHHAIDGAVVGALAERARDEVLQTLIDLLGPATADAGTAAGTAAGTGAG